MVGVGHHHPSIQWPKTPMDDCQGGNPEAVARLAEPCGPGALSFAVATARHIVHAEIAHRVQHRLQCGVLASLSVLRGQH